MACASSCVFSYTLSTIARWMSQPTRSMVASGVIARPVYGPTSRSASTGPICSASCATSFSTLKPTRFPAKAGASCVRTISRPRRTREKASMKSSSAGSVSRPPISSVPDDDVRRVEEVQAHEMAAERIAPPFRELVDREAGGDRRHDRVRTPRLLDAIEHLLLEREVLGQRLEHQIRRGQLRVQLLVAPDVCAVRDGLGAHLLDGGLEALLRLVPAARQERHAGNRLGEERARAVAHRAVRTEHHDVLEAAARGQPADLRRSRGHGRSPSRS